MSLRSLRYYEEKELLSPTRLQNGYREYTESYIERVGFIQLYSVLDVEESVMRETFETNYFGALRMIQASVPLMNSIGMAHR